MTYLAAPSTTSRVMVADPAGFPDVEACLRDLLADLVADPADVGTVIPADLQNRIAAGHNVIRLYRLGGSDDWYTDRPRIMVENYDATVAAARASAERVRQRLILRPHKTSSGVIDRAVTETGPAEWPYTDPAIRLIRATYRLSLRRRRTA
jgi:hypothetical protein